MFNTLIFLTFLGREQPPPRGCVLKLLLLMFLVGLSIAAASARLCVETYDDKNDTEINHAAASARLCVETLLHTIEREKDCSRLRAAVC